MAAMHSFMLNFESVFLFVMENLSQIYETMFYFCFLVFFFTLVLFIFSYPLYKRLQKTEQKLDEVHIHNPIPSDPLRLERHSAETVGKSHEQNPTHWGLPLLLEILPSVSSNVECLFSEEKSGDQDSDGSCLHDKGVESIGDQTAKKKKKRAKKKRLNLQAEEGGEDRCVGREILDSGYRANNDLVCLYPFTSSSSAMQRRIKQQYDELVKCNETKGLTLAQVGEFANCLIEARNKLQHKAEVIQRRFTITKALLCRADRSSFDRLHQQIYKVELEQRRLEDDAFVYNWLQQQLKISPAYKKMLEISASMESKAKSSELMETTDADFADISFEELLAREKKDSFWQRKSRSCSGQKLYRFC
ncbi:uncharacterized protein LOC121244217 isoform X1 [Juglans microcarpa x Juglans regia]|uniref:uncharacterized protein LOC121244217 isoform X1 n=1 Tax=Juglans microcarpa x Juglans regia TaxID=2249226 RepID=UPI001B7DE86B|nr:uncharacterized protein LOC121244217 isoform X1 [Juglans microcarpa x Juglans regia]